MDDDYVDYARGYDWVSLAYEAYLEEMYEEYMNAQYEKWCDEQQYMSRLWREE